MGDVADMMLDGTLCEGCGVYMGDECGFPRLCSSCAKERRQDGRNVRSTGLGGYQDIGDIERPQPKSAKVKCALCGKLVKQAGLHDHKRAVHPRDG